MSTIPFLMRTFVPPEAGAQSGAHFDNSKYWRIPNFVAPIKKKISANSLQHTLDRNCQRRPLSIPHPFWSMCCVVTFSSLPPVHTDRKITVVFGTWMTAPPAFSDLNISFAVLAMIFPNARKPKKFYFLKCFRT